MASCHPLPYRAPRPPQMLTKPVASAQHAAPPEQPLGLLSENLRFSCWPPTEKDDDGDDGDDDGDRRTTRSRISGDPQLWVSICVHSKVSFLLS